MIHFRDLPRRWRCVTAPRAEPLHITEAKAQCSLTSDVIDFDADFTRWIAAARQHFEESAEVALVSQVWELVLPRFPTGSEPVELWRPPVRGLVLLQYVDTAGETQDLEDYRADLDQWPAILKPAYGSSWPIVRDDPGAVRIQFRTGAAVPCSVDADADTLAPLPNDLTSGAVVRADVSGGSLPGGLEAATDYYVRDVTTSTVKLAGESGGSAIDLTSAGSGQVYLGEVPAAARQAIRLAVGHWWRNRESVVMAQALEMPQGFDALVHALHWRD